jgi:EPS-associated MarR family transcriptional regulator
MLSDEVRYNLLKQLHANPKMSQRDIARHFGVSLGKVNYCLKMLTEKGWIKVANYRSSQNKVAYMYLLTPRGIKQKAAVTARFLQRKMREYEQLRADIARICEDSDGEKEFVAVRIAVSPRS